MRLAGDSSSTARLASRGRDAIRVAAPDTMPAPQAIWDRPGQAAQTQNRGNTVTDQDNRNSPRNDPSKKAGDNAAKDVSGQRRERRP